MQIKDITARYNRPAKTRPESSITGIVVHHDAGPLVTSEAALLNLLDGYHHHHQSIGLGGLPYTYFIAPWGKVYKCNPTTRITNHARGGNQHNIGICVNGFFHAPRNNVPRQAQLASLDNLIAVLRTAIPTIQHIKPHRWVKGSSTACPGDIFMAKWHGWLA